MNKSIIFVLIIFISIGLFGFASAKQVKDDLCKCKARAVKKCGFGKSSEACKCRLSFKSQCQTRCSLKLKCTSQISEKCLSFKKGSLEYKRCERSVSAKNCVSLLAKSELYNCKCKTFSRAVCGSCPSPSSVSCRKDALKNCAKQCGKAASDCDNSENKRRICLSPPNCSCKTLASKRCAIAADPKSCYATEFDSCNKKCIAGTKCYSISCKNAGLKRCAKAVAIVCDKFSDDLSSYATCVAKKTQRCQSFEIASCKKARRLFKYRAECDIIANEKCHSLTGKDKCGCETKIRNNCVLEKKDKRKKFIRHSATCKKRAQELCDAKEHCKDLQACYQEETTHCLKRHHRRNHIVPPECVERVFDFCGSKTNTCYKKNIGKCTEIWLRRFCERKSFNDCKGDINCMKPEVEKCKSRLPKCWKNRQLCNDNNKCTDDVCDPNVGCLHVQKSCNDNNLCTTDTCDVKVGCKNTPMNCDDSVSCTIDSCNASNGQCNHQIDHTKCATADKCTLGYCTDKGCQYHKDDKCNPPKQPPTCDTCKPANACQIATCQIQSDLSVKCIYTEKDCNDGIKCTTDTCNYQNGQCVHTRVVSNECPTTSPSCKENLDCSSWGVEQNLSCKCSVAVCDAVLGVCVANPTSSTTCVTCDQCKQACASRDACDGVTTSCTRDASGNISCNRPITSCDDGSICTKDSCNINTGACEHSFIKSDACLETCESDNDCIKWAVASNLDKQCQTARCDKVKKSCIVVDEIDQSKCPNPRKTCKLCTPRNACETAKCFYDKNGMPACKRTSRSCNDGNICTKDSCNLTTGKCEHVFEKSSVCTYCKENLDCKAWGVSLKLDSICKEAVCDTLRNFCIVKDQNKVCTPPPCTNCVAANKCETVACSFDSTGKPHCARRKMICNDNDDCTNDTCDAATGKCVYTPVTSQTCTKCQFDVDCKSWGENLKLASVCREAYCNAKGKCRSRISENQAKCKNTLICDKCLPVTRCDQASCVVGESGVATCVHKQISCDDGNSCTQDYCDTTTGSCVHNPIKSAVCTGCKTDTDCAQYALDQKLSSKCQTAFCSENFCSSKASPDQTACAAIPVCPQCNATPCDEAECLFDDDGFPYCKSNVKSCDDGNKCTVDKCDSLTGDCVHTFFKSSQCQACHMPTDCAKWAIDQNLAASCKVAVCHPLGFCEVEAAKDTSKCPQTTTCSKDLDCNDWATKSNLAEQCLTAYCDSGSCKSKPINDLTKCTPPQCKTCIPANACETVACVNTEGGYICARKQKDCSDGIDCTLDSCDIKNGVCVHDTSKCHECSTDADCVVYAATQHINNCQVARCIPDQKICVIQPTTDVTCVPQYFCDQKCPAKDKCHKSKCHYDASKNVVCDTAITLSCDDNNDCTADSCDIQKGCVNTFTASDKCQKCSKDTDCASYAITNNLNSNCLIASCSSQGQCVSQPTDSKTCVPQQICQQSCATTNKCQSYGCSYDENKKVLCSYVVKTCNDGKQCTQDYCDTTSGLCVHVQSATCGPLCKTTLDCAQWGLTNKLADNCKQPFCDQDKGACVSVDAPDVTKCPVPNCKDVCPSTKCQDFTCAYDNNKKVTCTPKAINCDDGNDCTVDSCDDKVGCVHKYVSSPTCQQCSKDVDCSALAQQLGACFTVSCDTTTSTCSKKAVANPTCNHPPPSCPACVAQNKCQIATLVQDLDTCTCKVTNVTCDDKISCTVDSCDATTGTCTHVFSTANPQCTTQCTVDAQCAKYAIDNKLYHNCQLGHCNVQTGSCEAIDDTKTNCKKCHLDCKPNSNCDTAECVWVGTKYQCQHSVKSCDDGKSCTVDSCNAKTGQCVNTYNCTTTQCNTDVDCSAWGQANQLSAKCLLPVCNQNQGSCQSVPDISSGCTRSCKQSSDCPPTQFGSVCDSNKGQCVPNNCTNHGDCMTSNTDPNLWNYCTVCSPDGQKCCVPTPKCKNDTDCDDKNPCTKDVCLPNYGFCRNLAQCDDSNECTTDICTASSDGKTYSCSNPPVSCTQDASLLNSNFVLLSNDDKAKWLGKCDKNKGCVTCVVNAQCDDHNGCSTDSCTQQYCISVPINNAWCDPKLASQPIYYQSIPGLRTQLELAGYDINKLVS